MDHAKEKIMKRISILAVSITLSVSSFAQLTTPGTGENYDLSELSALDPSVLSNTGATYILHEDFTLSENDTLEVTTSDTLLTDAGKRITVEGFFLTDAGGNDQFFISSTDTLDPSDGIRFEESSVGSIKNTNITYTGGLKVMTENFLIEDCSLSYNVSGVSTGAAISLSRGAPIIQNNTFFKNDLPAVSSGANQNVAAHILNNWMEGNGQSNQNRPQLNMGPTDTDTLKIINNTIIGDPAMTEVGGIGVSNFLGAGAKINAIIESNTVRDNRYGITVMGSSANVSIKGNVIEDNDTQNNPNLGGSGISVNSSDDTQTIRVRENKIRRNLWGITVISKGSIDLGSTGDLGNNLFSENGNGGDIFALYNNTALDIDAIGNCWIETNDTADATDTEEVIFHQVDDSSLGRVDFSNWSCGILGTEMLEVVDFNLYPNPAQNSIHFSNDEKFEVVEFFTTNGQLLKTVELQDDQNKIDLLLPQGLYILHFSNDSQRITKKFMIK